jgi:hypothetical protein
MIAVPTGIWNLDGGDTVCVVDQCGHLEPACSGVLARQAAHERYIHQRTADRSGDG